MTTVSVIIPTHDRPAMLKESIDSVLHQTHVPIELIVVTDARGDGPFPTLERGLKLATGDWVCFFSDDDRMHSTFLETLLRHTSEGDIISSGVVRWNPSKGIEEAVTSFYKCNINATIFQMDIINDLRTARGYLFDPSVRFHGGEEILFHELASFGAVTVRIPQALIDYRIHPQQISRRIGMRYFLEQQHIRNMVPAFGNRFTYDLWMLKNMAKAWVG